MAKGILRAIGLALAWAFIFALPAVPIEGLANIGIEFPFTYAVDMWPAELGLPGLIGGLFFAGLLVATRHLGRFEHLGTGRLVGLGVIAGLMVAALYVKLVWPEPTTTVALIVTLGTVLGAVAAPGAALIFRLVASRKRGAAHVRA
jgi:hypothetical protein